jgi:glucose-1-phosphate cytidylyltransferase
MMVWQDPGPSRRELALAECLLAVTPRELMKMKTVILCGGLGTRLREETEFRPKPLVPVGERPILWHIMKIYSHAGYNDFVLCLGYRGTMIKEYFLNYQAMNNDFTICLGGDRQVEYHNAHNEQDFRVTLVDTGQQTMTGGRLARVRDYVGDGAFLLTYGDGVSDVDISALVEFHRSHGKLATVTTVRPPSRFGMLQVAASGRVEQFAEKPQMQGWASVGYMVLEPGVFDYLTGDDCIFEQEPLQRLALDGQLMAYRHEGFFFAMDTYREFQVLNELWDSGKAPWKVWKE